MPFQAGKCQECGERDYVEWVDGRWLCRYCRRERPSDSGTPRDLKKEEGGG